MKYRPGVAPVLIVEDEPDLAQLFKGALTDEGFEVQICDNLREAKIRSRNQKFSVILTDLNIKGGSGAEFIQVVRSEKQNPNQNTPVLLVSALVDRDVLEKLRGKFSMVLVKPVDLKKLVQSVETFLGSLSSNPTEV